jgi:Ni,Fe-hydrogenase III large subunit
VNALFLSAASVRHRLQAVGVVPRATAAEIGLVGMAARASGIDLDARSRLPGEPYASAPILSVVETAGDCWARARIRIREIDRSIAWLQALLARHPVLATGRTSVGALAPESLAVAVREGWRGEVVHGLETDAEGRVRHLRVQDPSLRNWLGLALAVRENAISDFPICNKSFDLSYCGNDL